MMLTVRSGKMTECVSFVIKSHFGYLLSVTEFEASSCNVDINEMHLIQYGLILRYFNKIFICIIFIRQETNIARIFPFPIMFLIELKSQNKMLLIFILLIL